MAVSKQDVELLLVVNRSAEKFVDSEVDNVARHLSASYEKLLFIPYKLIDGVGDAVNQSLSNHPVIEVIDTDWSGIHDKA